MYLVDKTKLLLLDTDKSRLFEIILQPKCASIIMGLAISKPINCRDLNFLLITVLIFTNLLKMSKSYIDLTIL